MSVHVFVPVASLAPAPRMADHPRFLEAVVGRRLELVVYSIEGVRERFHRTIH
jgi:hypothetical protein